MWQEDSESPIVWECNDSITHGSVILLCGCCPLVYQPQSHVCMGRPRYFCKSNLKPCNSILV